MVFKSGNARVRIKKEYYVRDDAQMWTKQGECAKTELCRGTSYFLNPAG